MEEREKLVTSRADQKKAGLFCGRGEGEGRDRWWGQPLLLNTDNYDDNTLHHNN